MLRFDLAVAEGKADEFTLNEVYTDEAAFNVRFARAHCLVVAPRFCSRALLPLSNG